MARPLLRPRGYSTQCIPLLAPFLHVPEHTPPRDYARQVLAAVAASAHSPCPGLARSVEAILVAVSGSAWGGGHEAASPLLLHVLPSIARLFPQLLTAYARACAADPRAFVEMLPAAATTALCAAVVAHDDVLADRAWRALLPAARSPAALEHLVRSLLQANHPEAAVAFYRSHPELHHHRLAPHVAVAYAVLGDAVRAEAALDVWWMARPSPTPTALPFPFPLPQVARAMAHHGQAEQLAALLTHAVRAGFRPDAATVEAAMATQLAAGNHPGVLEWVGFVLEHGVSPTAGMYRCVLQSLQRLDDRASGAALVKRLVARDGRRAASVVVAYLRWCGRRGLVSEAEAVYAAVDNPPVSMRYAMACVWERAGHVDKARAGFEETVAHQDEHRLLPGHLPVGVTAALALVRMDTAAGLAAALSRACGLLEGEHANHPAVVAAAVGAMAVGTPAALSAALLQGSRPLMVHNRFIAATAHHAPEVALAHYELVVAAGTVPSYTTFRAVLTALARLLARLPQGAPLKIVSPWNRAYAGGDLAGNTSGALRAKTERQLTEVMLAVITRFRSRPSEQARALTAALFAWGLAHTRRHVTPRTRRQAFELPFAALQRRAPETVPTTLAHFRFHIERAAAEGRPVVVRFWFVRMVDYLLSGPHARQEHRALDWQPRVRRDGQKWRALRRVGSGVDTAYRRELWPVLGTVVRAYAQHGREVVVLDLRQVERLGLDVTPGWCACVRVLGVEGVDRSINMVEEETAEAVRETVAEMVRETVALAGQRAANRVRRLGGDLAEVERARNQGEAARVAALTTRHPGFMATWTQRPA